MRKILLAATALVVAIAVLVYGLVADNKIAQLNAGMIASATTIALLLYELKTYMVLNGGRRWRNYKR